MPRLANLLKIVPLAAALAAACGGAQAQQAGTGTSVGANVSTTAPRPTLVQPVSRCLIFTGITKDKCLASEKGAKPQPRKRLVGRP